jgi:hypothetical protein
LLVLLLDGYLVWRYRADMLQSSGLRMLGLLSVLILLLLFLWWLYRFIDWRNDIYQVTDKFIFDIYRKPLGTESKQSAPLENILSMEHQRVGFLGYILNYGNVVINVGETRFIFMNVHRPCVQQDIFTASTHCAARKPLRQPDSVTGWWTSWRSTIEMPRISPEAYSSGS